MAEELTDGSDLNVVERQRQRANIYSVVKSRVYSQTRP